jgi:toxin-antitoxin system PIN domain toxin
MIVDANVLLYGVDETSHFHEAAKSWLENAFNGPERVGLPWQCLVAFVRISTHPRASEHPLTPEQAWDFVDEWLLAVNAWIPEPGVRHGEILRKLILEGNLRGNLVSDAHLAALAIEHGIAICSFDSDFARFPQVKWVKPE